MALYFVRHGESESNERNLFAGRFDTPLTALGISQARQARSRVETKRLRFDEVHSTPLSRARETAKLIVDDPAAIHIESPDLVERDFGLLSEQNKSLIKKYFGASEFESMFHSHHGTPPKGESFTAMYERVLKYYREVLEPKDRAGKTILVVAHKYIVEMFVLISAGLSPENYHDFRVPNCRPLDFDELKACVHATSPKLNHFAESVEARLAPLLVLASVLGGALRFITNRELPTSVFTAALIFLLAINSGFAILRLDGRVVKDSMTSFKRIWKGFLPRYIAGFLLMLFAKSALVFSLGTFLLLPPAMTAPTLSLAWGGDYFLSSQATLASTLLSPVLIALAALFSRSEFLATGQVFNYVAILAAAIGLPALIVQAFRSRDPIRAGALSTNWGWVGSGILIPLASLASYQFFSRATAAEVVIAIGLFIALRVFAALATLVKSKNPRTNLDRYITHIAPNIFFWFALLPRTSEWSGLRFTVTLFFFVSLYLEENRLVQRFPVIAHLNADLNQGI